MFHLWVIALFLVIVVHDSVRTPGADWGLSDQQAAALSLLPMMLLALGVWGLVKVYSKRLGRHGSMRSVFAADRVLEGGRWIAVLLHAFNVLCLGWLGVVRRVTGDLILIDEFVTILPPIGVFLVGWWAWYPIERTLRDAAIIGTMDSGGPVYPTPTCRQYVSLNVRHQLLPTLVPMALILGWSEAVAAGIARFAPPHGAGGLTEDALASIVMLGQLLGVGAVFFAAPLILRLSWDTVRLAPGAMRDRLLGMCRGQGVKVRDILVWRTHGSMSNGAVIGALAPIRYILLTDALLDSLSEREVEAVMAHEIAHVRHRHMPWLALTMLASVGVFAFLGSVVAGATGLENQQGQDFAAVEWLAAGIAFAAGLVAFGFVSRRFEWQSDAFAVQHLSGARRRPGQGEAISAVAVVAPAAVAAMVGALESVARLNHIPPGRFSWRHGSIRSRIDRLNRLGGRRTDDLPIDRVSRVIKFATLVVIGVLAAFAAREAWTGGGARCEVRQDARHRERLRLPRRRPRAGAGSANRSIRPRPRHQRSAHGGRVRWADPGLPRCR